MEVQKKSRESPILDETLNILVHETNFREIKKINTTNNFIFLQPNSCKYTWMRKIECVINSRVKREMTNKLLQF